MYILRYLLSLLHVIILVSLSGCLFSDIKSEIQGVSESKRIISKTPMPPKFDQLSRELAQQQATQQKNTVLLLDIKKIFSDLEPKIDDFDKLFKSSISTKGYRQYKKHLKVKIEALTKKTKGKKYQQSKLIYKMKVSKRKRKSKKEWVFGVDNANKLKEYYRSFKAPGKIEENKLLFTPVDNEGKPVVISEDDKTTILKSGERVVLYLYKIKVKKEEKVFIIDIPTFLDYAL